MLKSHLQPIVAYFNTSFSNATSDATSKSSSVVRPTATGKSHLQPAIDYYADHRVGHRQADLDHSNRKESRLLVSVRRLWHLLTTIDNDPRIKQHIDRNGQPYWVAYDPVVDRTFSFDAEEEVYRWIEQRYYQ